jgi:hypothetical protein
MLRGRQKFLARGIHEINESWSIQEGDTMTRKTIIFATALAVLLILHAGCGEDGGPISPGDVTPPAPPAGFSSITGDGNVTLMWRSNRESDFEAYNLYWGFDSITFNLMATTADTNYVDMDVRNGETVYYAASAFDVNGNESSLSVATFDTPRPTGYDVQLGDANATPSTAGFSFAAAVQGWGIVSADAANADFYFSVGRTDGVATLTGGNRTGTRTTLIMMWGPTTSFADMNYAPDPATPGSGYVANGSWPAFTGYTYVIQTQEGNFAQVRITNLVDGYAILDWAYQIDPYNPELGPSLPGVEE